MDDGAAWNKQYKIFSIVAVAERLTTVEPVSRAEYFFRSKLSERAEIGQSGDAEDDDVPVAVAYYSGTRAGRRNSAAAALSSTVESPKTPRPLQRFFCSPRQRKAPTHWMMRHAATYPVPRNPVAPNPVAHNDSRRILLLRLGPAGYSRGGHRLSRALHHRPRGPTLDALHLGWPHRASPWKQPGWHLAKRF